MNKKLFRILSLDGGGIRGILPAYLLAYMEEKLKELTNTVDAKLGDYFDLIAGTSTGGILACGLLCPDASGKNIRYNAKDLLNIFNYEGSKIFHRSFAQRVVSANGNLDEKYSSAAIENTLLEYFGDLKLSEAMKPCIITAYEIEKRYAHFFTQHDAKTKPAYDFYLRDVARATSAAPTYFEAAKITSVIGESFSLIDGGVFANNPSLCAVSEATKCFASIDKSLGLHNFAVLSIGTGSSRAPYTYDRAKNWGAIGWIKPVIDIMMSGVSDTVDYQLQQIFESLRISNQYVRINPDLFSANPDLDDASSKNIKALNEAGKRNVDILHQQVDAFLDLISDNVDSYNA